MSSSVPELAGIVLAAGGSSRLGWPKQLLERDGRALVRHAAETALSVCGAGVTVVTGAVAADVAAALPSSRALSVVHNPDWESGMASSLATGVRAVAAGPADAVLVMLCDQPRIGPARVAALAALWQNSPSAPAAAHYAGRAAVPAVFPRDWFGRLQALQG